MARTESRTKTAIWSDRDFRALTGNAQRVYWLLYSQANINLCGVLDLTIRRWADMSADGSETEIRTALEELADRNFVLIDYATEEILVRTFIDHDGVKRSPRTLAGAQQLVSQIQSDSLRAVAARALGEGDHPAPKSPSDHPPNGTQPVENNTPDTLSDTPSHTLSDTHRGRARAVSVSSLRLQPPVSAPTPPGRNGTEAAETLRDEVLRTNRRDDDGNLVPNITNLAARLALASDARSADAARQDARAVIAWAARHVDITLIDEAVAWAETRPPNQRIRLPRAIAPVIAGKAKDHGNRIPDYQGQVR